MTAEEGQKMMAEIMQVVDKHAVISEENPRSLEDSSIHDKCEKRFGMSDEKMRKWKEEYRKMRVDAKEILEEVMRNPIDTSGLISSFDIARESSCLK